MESNRGEKDCRFSFDHYRYILKKAERCDYKILSCDEYHKNRESLPERYVILRHDIEHYPDRAVEFAKIEAEFGFISTYFVRVHAKAYNIFNYKVYYDLKSIIEMGHEVGLHTEPIDFSRTSGEDPEKVFQKELEVLRVILSYPVKGVCPHVDWTEYNNIDFFKHIKLKQFGLHYHTYQSEFFKENFYVSDGQHYYWKNYQNGDLLKTKLCPCKIIEKGIPNIYLLTHPMNWFHTEYHLM